MAQKNGGFSVTKDGEVLYASGKGCLILAAAILEKGKEDRIIRILIFP